MQSLNEPNTGYDSNVKHLPPSSFIDKVKRVRSVVEELGKHKHIDIV